MEQACYKCGQAVEQGIPFCPHCSAPQIRVVIAEPALALAGRADAAAVAEGSSVIPASKAIPVLALPMHWSQALVPCVLAALLGSLLMTLGLNVFVAMVGVGFLAVVFYRQRHRGISLKATAGAGLGALGGLLWFAMSTVLEALVVIFLHKGPELRNELLERIQRAASQTSDPQVLAMFARLKTTGGLEALMVVGVVFGLIAAIALGALGGGLSAAVFRHRDKP